MNGAGWSRSLVLVPAANKQSSHYIQVYPALPTKYLNSVQSTTKMASSDAATGPQIIGQFHVVSATYQSPNNAPFSSTHKLAAPLTSATSERVTYLASLRKATAELQETINKELTQRMEEDKMQAAAKAVTAGGRNGVVDEAKEEQNYGEEVVEED